MSKLIPPKDLGVPVLTNPPAGTTLVAYYGPKGFTPAYTPVAPNGRIVVGDVSTLAQKTVNGEVVYDDPIGSELPAGMTPGQWDVVFTFMDANQDESDFSAPVTIVVPSAPPTPGQPIVLG